MSNSNIIITNIKVLVGILPKNKLVVGGKEMNELSILKNAFIEVKDDKIQSFGSMKDLNLNQKYNYCVCFCNYSFNFGFNYIFREGCWR